MLQVGDTVKVISATKFGDKYVERIKIGTICTVMEIDHQVNVDFPNSDYILVRPKIHNNGFGLTAEWYKETELEKVVLPKMIQIGDTVKVISTTEHMGEQKEFIKIGTICKVVHIDEENHFIAISPKDDYNSAPFYYKMSEIEKGEMLWVTNPKDNICYYEIKDSFTIESGCTGKNYPYKEFRNYKFCPFCGKRKEDLIMTD